MADASVTRRAFSLGARDSTTGHCASEYAESTIKMIIVHQGQPSSPILSSAGLYAKYPHTGYTRNTIVEDDQIIDGNSRKLRVLSQQPIYILDVLKRIECNLQPLPSGLDTDFPAASEAWHEDNDSTITDVRFRIKTWLGDNLPDVYEDDGSTPADEIVMFAKPPYHLWREFSALANDIDVIAWIESANVQAVLTHDGYPYKFKETATVRIGAVNKTGVTGTRLVEEYEQAIREVATLLPVTEGARKCHIESEAVSDEDLGGGVTLYSRTLTISYQRANDDYLPAYPTIDWGPSANHTGIWIWPNVLNTPEEGKNKDAWLDLPSYSGTSPQALGSKSIDIEVISDPDFSPSGLTWKRSQTGSKTDNSNWDIFRDLLHNEGIDQPYHTLTLSANGPAFHVRLVSYRVEGEGDEKRIHVLLREDRSTSAAALTYEQRLVIT